MRSYILLVALFLSGCSSINFKLPNDSSTKPATSEQISLLRNLVSSRWQEAQQIRLLMRGQLKISNDKQGLKAALVWSAPWRLRFETYPTVGSYSLTLLVANDQEATFLDNASKTALRGDDQKTLEEILGVPIQRQELVGFILARLPLDVFERRDLKVFQSNESGDFIIIWNGDRSWARLEEESGLIRETNYGDAAEGSLVLEVKSSGRFDQLDIPLPAKIEIVAPERDFSLELSLTSANLPTTLSDRLFQVQIPADFDLR